MTPSTARDLLRTPAHGAFLEEAECNLVALADVCGPDSVPYRQLMRRYRAVAEALHCRPALEAMLERLCRERVIEEGLSS